ncbi:MAG TPA: hypothetical protein P5572_03345 [Phycisphaerae bacterium]|nr:hypothetical protein [Phycisphaerales bacterium]HRX84035.1 hypothetical protein [Phycisphaerae bacterium]
MHPSIQPGTVAAFAIGDVLCPHAGEVMQHAGPELRVRGRVLYFSDGGTARDHFAIVEVDGIHTPLIVPVANLQVERHAETDRHASAVEAAARLRPEHEAASN